MNNEDSRKDIRRLLKTFGIKADEAITAHIAAHPDGKPLHLRLVLQDLTDYEDGSAQEALHLEVEDEIRR